MRFTSVLLAGVAGLAPTVLADWMETTWGCDVDLFIVCGVWGKPYSHFHTDFGKYDVGRMYDGCHHPPVPGMTDLCVDRDNKRAHFKFGHQDYKRCLRMSDDRPRFIDDSCPALECWHETWNEVECNW